ncbi:MAG: cyclic peptide export ABC transporter [Candidatus Omnitrophota bacterium]
MKRKIHPLLICFTILFVFIAGNRLNAGTGNSFDQIEKKVTELMDKGDIPGLALVIIKGNEPVYIKGFGYANKESKIPVTDKTLFEWGSTSKAMTALAVMQCEADGLIKLDEPISTYLPTFYLTYKGKKYYPTLRQFLNQTTGVPFKSIALIPESNEKDALEKTVQALTGTELDFLPGTRHFYATINYDVLGLVIQKVSGMPYEEYVKQKIVNPLGLNRTYVGRADNLTVAQGYKVSFFSARPYDAPTYKGNTPAGYIISDAIDLSRWLKCQLGMEETPLYPLMQKTHQADPTVPVDRNALSSYAMGWYISQDGSGEIQHGGNNPNFTSQFIFQPRQKIAVGILTNSNSTYTPYIANTVMNLVTGKPLPSDANLGAGIDKGASIFFILACVCILLAAIFILLTIFQIVTGKRKFEKLTAGRIIRPILILLAFLPFIFGVYLLPFALVGISWKVASVWAPSSFKLSAIFAIVTMGISYLGYLLSFFFPHQNKYVRSAPSLMALSLLSGASNSVVIFLITISLYANIKLHFLVYYFILAMCLYLFGRKELQVRLVQISFNIIYDLRIRLVDRIFKTSYQKFEKLDTGRVIATLNNDTNTLGGIAQFAVTVMSSIVTIIGAFVYLGTIAFWSTMVTLVVISIVAVIYSIVSQRARALFETARNTQNVYMGLLNGLRAGFKELSLHFTKKQEFRKEIGDVTDQFRENSAAAMINFVNAFMVGESMLIVVLASVGFGIPVLIPDMSKATLMSFIMVLLYLIGPVTGILNSIPGIVQIRVAWQRIQGLMKDIPANIQEAAQPKLIKPTSADVESINAKNVYFEYETKDESEKFVVGPIDFDAKKGEIIFIIGGNGSGKTTLAKLLTGLYIPEKGSITLDGKPIDNEQLGEFYSAVFGDYHLFEKLYDIDLTGKEQEVKEYLEMLRLEEKVKLENNAFSTVELSGGQRKRLALLRCYLEDRPIYLFDEVAADQDPEFRKFFYRTLLTRMKEKGKMIIAITHDDHYFDVADKVIKMEMGKIELIESPSQFSVTK